MRLRLVFSKDGPLTYISHLDLVRVWERALRRAGVPLAYSAGFNPRPRLHLAAALPLGHTGEEELLDMWLERPAVGGVGALVKFLAPVLPAGLTVREVYEVPLKEPPLQTRVIAAEYRVTVEWSEPVGRVAERVRRLLDAEAVPHERRGRRYDLRPLIEELWVEQIPGFEKGIALEMRLSARQKALGRPEAVLEALGMEGAFARFHRRRLILS